MPLECVERSKFDRILFYINNQISSNLSMDTLGYDLARV
jgi:hypothetical protein